MSIVLYCTTEDEGLYIDGDTPDSDTDDLPVQPRLQCYVCQPNEVHKQIKY